MAFSRAILLSISLVWAGVLCAEDNPLLGSYDLTYGTGQVGIYTVVSISSTQAEVSYSYGGKTKSAVLRVQKNKIRGNEWFPTVWFDSQKLKRASLSGNRAAIKKMRP